jgi:phosphoglucosamine mutase
VTLRFGTDGVRGEAGVELTAELALALGRAAARVFGTGAPFVIGRDTRRSGAMLEAALAAGLTAEGADVVVAGVLPTPAVAFVSQRDGCPGAMISASHNPWPDNGIKFFAPGGRKLDDATEERIEAELDALVHGAAAPSPRIGGMTADPGVLAGYAAHLAQVLQGRRLDGLAVAIDCANGSASVAAATVLQGLGAKVEVFSAAPDGTNINQQCGSTYPDVLRRQVVALGADAGLAFDGDADRLIAVDEAGELVDGDHLLAISALDMRARGELRNDTVVATVMANLGFRRAMESHGVSVVETAVGDRYVLEAMTAGNLALGGEQSGHLIYADAATTGDGLLSGLILLDTMARTGRRLSDLASIVTKFPQVLRNVRVANRAGLDGAGDFWAEVRAVEAEMGPGGRVLVRPSGTEPLVRIMVEAASAEAAEAHSERLTRALTAALG